MSADLERCHQKVDSSGPGSVVRRVPQEGPSICYYLCKATGKLEHLAEAKRLLDYRVEHAPEAYRESMLKNVRLHREILEAWANHGEKAVGEGDAE